MKNSIAVLAITLLVASLGFAGQKGQDQNTSGYLVDIMCGTKHASEGDGFGAKHTKQCLQMPDCVKSGYAVLTSDKKLLKFDQKGNEQVAKLIASTDRESDIRVTVSGPIEGDVIKVSSIRLAQ